MKRKISRWWFFTLVTPVFVLGGIALAREGEKDGSSRGAVRVGVATILSGDLAVLGENIVKTVDTYRRCCMRVPLEFVVEDARKGSASGLSAYKKLIELDDVHVLIGGTTSNGTLAAAPLINASGTPLITPLTGGSNIDQAGELIFRVGNSDILNGTQQADVLIERRLRRVALFTEQTEYTLDIAQHFRRHFAARGGKLVFDEEFLPDRTSFKSEITKMIAAKPDAVFVATQTGLAFGIFAKELRQLGAAPSMPIFTNFLAAANPDALAAGGEALRGVYYLAPEYDAQSEELLRFFEAYRNDHGHEPAIPFHTAGVVDTLNILQDYIIEAGGFEKSGFQRYLSERVKGYRGLMGTYSLDEQGNSDLGFKLSHIELQ